MSATRSPRIGLLSRGDPKGGSTAHLPAGRLHRVFEALEARGAQVESVTFDEMRAAQVEQQLLALDAVLVWVNPLDEGRDRSVLDALLRRVAQRGVRVSAHPDVILEMGTKEVLHRTRMLGWGTDTHIYRTVDELRRELPMRLAAGRPRVLKQNRGNGGNGIWKVEGTESRSVAGERSRVRVLHALRGSIEEELALAEFVARIDSYFARGGCIVDQPFQARLPEGMIRCYLVHERVVGFGQQLIKALIPPPPGADPVTATQPGPRLMYGASAQPFQRLRTKLEDEWVPQMQQLLDIDKHALPAIWDADLLLGPRDRSGADTYVLCEINVSSVFPFPDEAIEPLADAAQALASLSARVTA